MRPVTTTKAKLTTQNHGLSQGICICLAASWLNQSSDNCARISAIAKAIATNTSDSPKNCAINCCLNEPTAFRMPTSRARFSLRAVERFMKLIQASTRTNVPISPTSQTIRDGEISEPLENLSAASRCHLDIGYSVIWGCIDSSLL